MYQPAENDAPAEIIRLTAKEFNENQGRNHAFFSHFRPDYLFTQLTEKLTQQGQPFEMSNKTWKLNFEVSKQINNIAADGQQEAEPIYERA